MLREAEYPDEFANILFDAAICLSEIKTIVKRNYIMDDTYINWSNQPRCLLQVGYQNPYGPKSFKEFFIDKRWIPKQSDELYSRMDSTQLTVGRGGWAVDFFVELYSDFKELTVEELIQLRELAEPVPDIIKSFMPQHEMLEKIRIESVRPWYRDAQGKFLGELVSAFESPIIAKSWTQARENRKLVQIYRKFILGDFRFRTQSENANLYDTTYTNWLDNIPDLMLNYFNCYINMINTLIQLPERLERERLEREETKKRRQKKKRLKSIAKKKARTLSLRRLREEKGEDLQIRTQSQELPEIVRIKERTTELKEKKSNQKKCSQSTSKNADGCILAGKKVKITRKYNK